MATAAMLPDPASALKGSPVQSSRGMVKLDQRRMKVKGLNRKGDINVHQALSPSDSTHTPTTEDPLRILAPAQKKLTTIESQRVLGVMDETIKRLEGVAALPILVNSLDRFSVSLGAELVALLEDYSQLVHQYNAIHLTLHPAGSATSMNMSTTNLSRVHMLQRDGLGYGSPVGSRVSLQSNEGSITNHHRLEPLEAPKDVEISEETLQAVSDRLKHVVKCILRALNKNPSSASVLKASTSGWSKNANHLMDSMR